MHQLQEECFEARDQLSGQSTELETLRQQAIAVARVRAAEAGGDSEGLSGGGAAAGAAALADAALESVSDPLATFKVALSRGQVADGKRVVQMIKHLKLPDE